MSSFHSLTRWRGGAFMLALLGVAPAVVRAQGEPAPADPLSTSPLTAPVEPEIILAHAGHGSAHAPAKEHGKTGNAAAGRPLFVKNCAGCHGEQGVSKSAPQLKGTIHSSSQLAAAISKGVPPKMPAFKKTLSSAQIGDVIAYIRALGPPMSEADHERMHRGTAGHGASGHGKGARPHTHGAAGEDSAMPHGAMPHGAMPDGPAAMDHQDGATGHNHAAMSSMDHMAMDGMTSRVPGGGMTRQGSGTSWEPESTLMWARMAHWGKWMIMQHGNAVVMYDAQTGPRGISRPASTNWYMAMGTRPLGRGELMLRTMLSLEPATIGNNGQPQLFQTGEGLIDRQHPHDFFMEIASQYSHPLSSKLGAYLYLAPVGEPALGPVAFMHRASAMEIPTAPLTHHWLDSSHISFGVVTAGLQSNRWKGELSWFNGHEPDGQRWDIDPIGLNSVSGRLSYAPNPHWVFQVSRGHLDKPEIYYTPEQGDVDRTTFSAQYFRPMKRGFWATTFAWGRNEGGSEGGASGKPSDGFLLESNYNWADRNYLFGRIERVDKDELFPESDPRSHRQFLVNAFSLGYARDIGHSKSFETALGAMLTVYAKDSSLDKTYGDFPVGVQLFLRIRPRRMAQMAGMDHEEGMEHMDHMHMQPGEKAPAAPKGHQGHMDPMHHGSVPRNAAPRLAALLALRLAEADGRFVPVAR